MVKLTFVVNAGVFLFSCLFFVSFLFLLRFWTPSSKSSRLHVLPGLRLGLAQSSMFKTRGRCC